MVNHNMKTILLFLVVVFLFSCKKYDCECVSVYSNPPKGNTSTSSVQKVNAISKSRANVYCKKYEDANTTCQLK